MKKTGIIPIVLIIWQLTQLSLLASEQRFCNIGNLQLHSGKVFPDFTFGYRVYGALNADSSNVIIYPTWFGGTSGDIEHILGVDGIIDSSNYYIIAIDAPGNGISSSPSNYYDSGTTDFPELTMSDVARGEYLLLRKLGFRRVYAGIGGSMGGMQIYELIVQQPDFMEKAVIYASTPAIGNSDYLVMSFEKKLLESALECNSQHPGFFSSLSLFEYIMARTTIYFDSLYSSGETDTLLDNWRYHGNFINLQDWLCQVNLILSHNIYHQHNLSLKALVKRVKTRLLLIIPEKDRLLTPQPSLKLSQVLKTDLLLLANICGHLAIGCALDSVRSKIEIFLK